MPEVVFETKIPMFERSKTVHALDRAATVIGENLQDSLCPAVIRTQYLQNSNLERYSLASWWLKFLSLHLKPVLQLASCCM
jgi:hypothetical protein